jgi:hypothetical protein
MIYCDIRCSIRRRWWVLTKLCRNSQDTTSISAGLAESCRVDSLSGWRICGFQFKSSAGFINAHEAPNTSWGERLLRSIGKEHAGSTEVEDTDSVGLNEPLPVRAAQANVLQEVEYLTIT